MITIQATARIKEKNLAEQIVCLIKSGEIEAAISMLRHLATFTQYFPYKWLIYLAKALEIGNFDLLSKAFINLEFLGIDGLFLIIAPYRNIAEGQCSVELTAIFGQIRVSDCSVSNRTNVIDQSKFQKLSQESPRISPYKLIAAYGNITKGANQVFVIADNWEFKDSIKGLSFFQGLVIDPYQTIFAKQN